MTTVAFSPSQAQERLALLVLALASFITILTAALPVGLLPQISAGLGVSAAPCALLVNRQAEINP